jgi:SsrA-binding protein
MPVMPGWPFDGILTFNVPYEKSLAPRTTCLLAGTKINLNLCRMGESEVRIKNRRASFEYAFLEQAVAGIQLRGTEIKSIRAGQAGINEAFCQFKDDGLYIINMHIAEYTFGTYANHEPKRERKLLMQSGELKRWKKKVTEKGLTIIPTLLFISDSGYAKLNLALAEGKKLHGKRDSLRDKDTKREIDRLMKDKR